MNQERFEKFDLDVEVSCHVDGNTRRLALYDLSPEGCMVEAPAGLFAKGRKLAVALPGGLIVRARLAWQRGARLGLRFIEPLDHDLVKLLGARIRRACELRYAPRDRFGRPISGLPVFGSVITSLRPRSGKAFPRGPYPDGEAA